MVYIYILKLKNGKFYVGKTNNPSARLAGHFGASNTAWTNKYRPLSVLEIIPDCDDYDEDKYTIKYMEKYGVNNVRGGSFCEVNLSEANIITLEQIIRSVTDRCYICGLPGHYAKDCKSTKLIKNMINTRAIDNNEQCNCPTSYFSPHRRNKCLLNNAISCFEEKKDT
jgi:predicted GIY-YIG superfamily endonuclease